MHFEGFNQKLKYIAVRMLNKNNGSQKVSLVGGWCFKYGVVYGRSVGVDVIS
jgi:hypothetical protein